MKRIICPNCRQNLPKARFNYLKTIREAVIRYHSIRRPELLTDEPSIEIVVRLNGTVIELIPPEAFEITTPEIL